MILGVVAVPVVLIALLKWAQILEQRPRKRFNELATTLQDRKTTEKGRESAVKELLDLYHSTADRRDKPEPPGVNTPSSRDYFDLLTKAEYYVRHLTGPATQAILDVDWPSPIDQDARRYISRSILQQDGYITSSPPEEFDAQFARLAKWYDEHDALDDFVLSIDRYGTSPLWMSASWKSIPELPLKTKLADCVAKRSYHPLSGFTGATSIREQDAAAATRIAMLVLERLANGSYELHDTSDYRIQVDACLEQMKWFGRDVKLDREELWRLMQIDASRRTAHFTLTMYPGIAASNGEGRYDGIYRYPRDLLRELFTLATGKSPLEYVVERSISKTALRTLADLAVFWDQIDYAVRFDKRLSELDLSQSEFLSGTPWQLYRSARKYEEGFDFDFDAQRQDYAQTWRNAPASEYNVSPRVDPADVEIPATSIPSHAYVRGLAFALRDGDASVRRHALDRLMRVEDAKFFHPELQKTVQGLLKHDDDLVRSRAYRLVAKFGLNQPSGVETMMELLTLELPPGADQMLPLSPVGVNELAALALGSNEGDKQHRRQLLQKALASQDLMNGFQVWRALALLGRHDPQAAEAAWTWLSSQEEPGELLGRLSEVGARDCLSPVEDASGRVFAAVAASSYLSTEDLISQDDAGLRKALPTLLRIAREPATEDAFPTRRRAVEVLGLLGIESADVTDALLAALKDDDFRLRQAAVSALAKLNATPLDDGPRSADVMAALFAALKDEDFLVCRAAAIALGEMNAKPSDAASVDAAIDVLIADGGYVDIAIGKVLRNAGPSAATRLAERLNNGSLEEVKISLIECLGAIGADAKDTTAALLKILQDAEQPEQFRWRAGNALVSIDSGVLAPHWDALSKDPEASVRHFAVFHSPATAEDLLQQLGAATEEEIVRLLADRLEKLTLPPSMLPSLQSLATDENEYVRAVAYAAIGRMGPAAKPAVPFLAKQLSAASDHEWKAIVSCLESVRLVTPDIVAVLVDRATPDVDYLSDQDWAISALGAMDDIVAREALIKLLKNGKQDVRRLAAIQLEQSDLEPITFLRDLLKYAAVEPNEYSSEIGLKSLAAIKEFPAWSIEPLIDLLTHESPLVRASIENLVLDRYSGRPDITLRVLDASLRAGLYADELVTIAYCLAGDDENLAQLITLAHSPMAPKDVLEKFAPDVRKDVIAGIGPNMVTLRRRLDLPPLGTP